MKMQDLFLEMLTFYDMLNSKTVTVNSVSVSSVKPPKKEKGKVAREMPVGDG